MELALSLSTRFKTNNSRKLAKINNVDQNRKHERKRKISKIPLVEFEKQRRISTKQLEITKDCTNTSRNRRKNGLVLMIFERGREGFRGF